LVRYSNRNTNKNRQQIIKLQSGYDIRTIQEPSSYVQKLSGFKLIALAIYS
jgi:hypothetical protein